MNIVDYCFVGFIALIWVFAIGYDIYLKTRPRKPPLDEIQENWLKFKEQLAKSRPKEL
jgi:hypothetical protein